MLGSLVRTTARESALRRWVPSYPIQSWLDRCHPHAKFYCEQHHIQSSCQYALFTQLVFNIQTEAQTAGVPDHGATTAMLGLALAGLGALRRTLGA